MRSVSRRVAEEQLAAEGAVGPLADEQLDAVDRAALALGVDGEDVLLDGQVDRAGVDAREVELRRRTRRRAVGVDRHRGRPGGGAERPAGPGGRGHGTDRCASASEHSSLEVDGPRHSTAEHRNCQLQLEVFCSAVRSSPPSTTSSIGSPSRARGTDPRRPVTRSGWRPTGDAAFSEIAAARPRRDGGRSAPAGGAGAMPVARRASRSTCRRSRRSTRRAVHRRVGTCCTHR